MSVSQIFKVSVNQTLTQLAAILEKAAAHAAAKSIPEEVFLNARLFPDMFALTRQVQIASDIALRGAARLSGGEVPSTSDNETSFAQLIERVKKSRDTAMQADDAKIDANTDQILTVPLGPMTLQISGLRFLSLFVLPNLHFHSTTTYDILRHNGVELGKMDYLGAF